MSFLNEVIVYEFDALKVSITGRNLQCVDADRLLECEKVLLKVYSSVLGSDITSWFVAVIQLSHEI